MHSRAARPDADEQRGDEVKIDNLEHALDATPGASYLIKVGKRRFAKITFP